MVKPKGNGIMSGKWKIALAIVLALAVSAAFAKDDNGKKRTKRTRTEKTEKVEKKTSPAVESEEKDEKAEADGSAGNSELSAADANRAAGVALFDDGRPLWESAPTEVFKRMKLSMPKGGENNPVLSVFTHRKVSCFGCGVEEFRVFVREGKIVRIDIMFLNKGDSVKVKVVSSNRSDFSKRLQREERELQRTLGAAFGSPVRGVFGSGKQARQMPHWLCREAAIAVEMNDREFLMAHLIPREQVGRRKPQSGTNRIDRSKIDLTKNIRRKENGDVFIAGVPMVDQGSKGYCVPATLERYFRYYGITDFDMHRIADVGRTAAGGGTTLAGALNGLHKMLHDSRLSVSSCGKLRMGAIVSAIDKGMPLIWALNSSPYYVSRLKEHNAAREKCESVAAWKKELRKMRRIHSSTEGAHMCLIIGYNSTTGEIAVSNSWGAGAANECSWVRFADAVVADQGCELYVIRAR